MTARHVWTLQMPSEYQTAQPFKYRTNVSWYGIQMVVLVHRIWSIDQPFEYWTIWNPNFKKFGTEMFPIFKWSVSRSPLYLLRVLFLLCCHNDSALLSIPLIQSMLCGSCVQWGSKYWTTVWYSWTKPIWSLNDLLFSGHGLKSKLKVHYSGRKLFDRQVLWLMAWITNYYRGSE